MRTRSTITFALSVTFLSLTAPISAAASTIDDACADVEIIVARGSGQPLGESKEVRHFVRQLQDIVGDDLSTHVYELGTESYNGNQYPAVNVSHFWNGNAFGAFLSGGTLFDYGESVAEGRYELAHYGYWRWWECQDSRFVFAGYSQGAQVIGEGLDRLTSVAPNTDFVALFGDPKLYLPEGEGWRPPACRGEGEELSPWRRDVPDCRTDNGSLGARKPYLPPAFIDKTGLWCNNDDYVCGSSKFGKISGHMAYADPGNGAEQAAIEAAQRIDASLGGRYADHWFWNINRGGTDLDVVFVLDTTGSMSTQLVAARRFARDMADAVEAANGRVALVTYRDKGDAYTARVDVPLTDDLAAFLGALNRQVASGGGDEPEAALHGLMTAFDNLDWKDGATKAAVVISDAGWHEPDKVDGTTLESMAARSLEIDPVNVYPVVPQWLAGTYQPMAEQTSGKVIVDSGDTVAALMEAFGQITARPVVKLPNTYYEADVHQQVIFDASRSYGIGAEVTRYEWDLDGDGSFEAATTEPVFRYTYTEPFDGYMQVRVTDTAGGIGSHSVPVRIGQPVDLGPEAPVVTVTPTGTPGEVQVGWTSPGADRWLVALDDFTFGFTYDNPITISDLPTDRTYELRVTPIAPDGRTGRPATVTIDLDTRRHAALTTTGDLALTNTFTLIDGAVATGGNFTCDSSVSIDGGLTVVGDAYLTNDCHVAGNLVAGGRVRMDSRATVDGSVRAGGDIIVHSGNRIAGAMVAGGSVTSGEGWDDAALMARGVVGGPIGEGVDSQAPDPVDPADLEVDTSDATPWATWVNRIATANGAPGWAQGLAANPGCTMASAPYSVNGAEVAVTTTTVIDARAPGNGCPVVSLHGMALNLSGDLTIVADGLSTVGTFDVRSADGRPHTLRIVATGPTAGIDLATRAVGDPLIDVRLDAAGTVTVQNGADLNAQIHARGFRSHGTVTVRGQS